VCVTCAFLGPSDLARRVMASSPKYRMLASLTAMKRPSKATTVTKSVQGVRINEVRQGMARYGEARQGKKKSD
jgi:hypothetical protein